MPQALESGYVQLFAAAPGKPIHWRLLSGNNREVGRGALSYADEDAARQGVCEVQRDLDELSGSVRRRPSNAWGWQLARGEEILVVSGRDYDRMIRCEQALDSFVRTFRGATVSPSILVSSSRRWEARVPSGGTGGRAVTRG